MPNPNLVMKKLVLYLLLCIGLWTAAACFRVQYSARSASIDYNVIKTINITQFANQAPNVVPTLSQKLSEKMRDKFVKQTSLKFIASEPDIQFDGIVTDYSVETVGLQANPNANINNANQAGTTNRLTIKVKVNYTNNKTPKQSWEQELIGFANFSAEKTLSSVENQLIEEITDNIVEQIFNKTFSSW